MFYNRYVKYIMYLLNCKFSKNFLVNMDWKVEIFHVIKQCLQL